MILPDTHAWIWWSHSPEKLSPNAKQAIGGEPDVLLSAISFREFGLLATRGRLELDKPPRAWLRDAMIHSGIRVVPVEQHMAEVAGGLGMDWDHRDPADRMIAATAIAKGCPLVTKDATMASYPGLQTLR